MKTLRKFLVSIAATSALALGVHAAQAESEGGDSYLKCKPGYELNFNKTKCVKR